jgi:hypothetical protein
MPGEAVNGYLFTELEPNKDAPSDELNRKSWTKAEVSFTI